MGSDSDGVDYESLAIPLAVAILHHSSNTRHTLLLVFVDDEDSRRLRHVAVDARDRREPGGRQSSSRKPHTACFFPSPHLQSLSFICVCLVQRIRASVYVVERSPSLVSFRDNFVEKKICY